jgi:DNA-directed RNA polymerase sigma subunit (sigma70/sigma32)
MQCITSSDRHQDAAGFDQRIHDASPGWDALIQAVLDSPDARIPAPRRQRCLRQLTRAMAELSPQEATVLTLRYRLAAGDIPGATRSYREVSETIHRSCVFVAALERSGLAHLRDALRRLATGELRGQPIPPSGGSAETDLRVASPSR